MERLLARRITPLVRWAIFAAITIASSVLIIAATKYAVADHWAESMNPALWLRAAQLESANADYWYHLGRYRQLDFENSNLPLAISYYERATRINPGSPSMWMDLGSAYETAGDAGPAEQAFQKAQQDYPISAQVAWAYGNFLLRQNRTQEAFGQVQRAVRADPNLTAVAVSRCWRSTQDINQILDFALPPTAAAYWGAIEFFVQAQEPEAATAVWKRLAALKTSFPVSNAFPVLALLVSSGRADDAQMVWRQALSAAATAPEYEPSSSLVWNGSFEHELLNGGLAWQYKTIAGASMDLDDGTAQSGSRSFRVAFDGTVNVDFANLWQYIIVAPNTRYRFSTYTRAEDVTTDSGIRFEIVDLKQGTRTTTSNKVGTQPWSLDQIELTTGPQTKLLQIILRRFQSNMLGNKIRGTAWVDNVSLTALPASGPTTK
jgi:hypothetical protein